jgi:ribosomal protein S12 methylthiotransferase accessory factor
MSRPPVSAWYASPFTGLFRRCGPIPPRPHDPAVCGWAGTLLRDHLDDPDLSAGGAGWDEAAAEAAGVGEAIERWQCRLLPQDGIIESAFRSWPLDKPAVDPRRWVLFHADQYAAPGFPYQPLTPDAVCHWVCCRDAVSGLPVWVPEDFVFLQPHRGSSWRFAPAISTGLSCGRSGDPVLLRGLQEVIERDAVVGAWWDRYPLEEYAADDVFGQLPPSLPPRLRRPNLRYRCYRVATPFSAQVTLATVEGEDREGWCFSIGSACRETRAASWEKALLEAVQGRHYVRYLLRTGVGQSWPPEDFAAHAIYYSRHRNELGQTVLSRAGESGRDGSSVAEGLPELMARLGPQRSVLFRDVTPPALASEGLGWLVLRVIVPGTQPLHGHHWLPFLGGPLWGERPPAEWRNVPPHPFP